jgi:alpha-tubulin suppressor-like RCC1 family protein
VDNPDQSVAPSLINVSNFSLNDGHACAVYNHHVACWGNNSMAQVGPESSNIVSRPNAVRRADQTAQGAEITDALDVTAGAYHTCLLTQSGGVECWGYNGDGEVGTDPATDQFAWPQPVKGLERVIELSAGDFFTCALVDAGDVYCWGDNSTGQLANNGGPSPQPVKVQNVANVQHIASGAAFACALSGSGKVTCWGQNASGQCGVSPVAQIAPQPVDLANVAVITAGAAHACAVDSVRQLYCWGDNQSGQLGLGNIDTDHHPTPTKVKALK